MNKKTIETIILASLVVGIFFTLFAHNYIPAKTAESCARERVLRRDCTRTVKMSMGWPFASQNFLSDGTTELTKVIPPDGICWGANGCGDRPIGIQIVFNIIFNASLLFLYLTFTYFAYTKLSPKLKNSNRN